MPRKQSGSRYVEVTSRIVEALEKGVTPWERPWICGQPRNAETGRRYRGINRLLLDFTALERGYSSPGWLTYAAARRLGGYVRRGETGTMVIYYERFEKQRPTEPSWDQEVDRSHVYLARHFWLWNLDQVDGLEALRTSFAGLFASTPHDAVAEDVLNRPGATIRYGGDGAAYNPEADEIMLPPREAFPSPEAFYSTAFHELGHWAGHPSRLDRPLSGRFGEPEYAQEELVAELTSSYLCSHAGLDVVGQSASYIDSWINLLNRDCRAIFVAAREAQSAADFILGEWAPEVEPATSIGAEATRDGLVAVTLD